MLLMVGWGAAIFFIVLVYGMTVERILVRHAGGRDAPSGMLLRTWSLGLAAVTTLASLLSLVMPLSAGALAIIVLGAMLFAIALIKGGYWSDFKKLLLPAKLPALVWLLAGLVLVSVLEIATHRGDNPDSGIYHMQAIRWMETYPIVPGLGNFHTRFAYNSAWLVANAVFSLAFVGGQSFHILPAMTYLVFLWHGITCAATLFTSSRRPSDWLSLALIPLSFYALASEVSSPGTDFPAILLYWGMLLLAARLVEQPRSQLLRASLIIMGVFLVTVKLSMLPALLLIVWAAWGLHRLGAVHLLRLAAFMGGLVLLPWLARNLLLSGYLVYPLTFTAFPWLDWMIPPQLAQEDALAILTWGRLPNVDVDMVAAMPLREWVPIWFSDQTRNRQLLLVAVAALPPMQALALWFGRRSLAGIWLNVKPYLLLIAVAYVGVFYWFLTAPLFRYGIGVVLAALVLALLPLWQIVDRAAGRWRSIIPALVILMCLYQGDLLARSFDPRSFADRLVLPADVIKLRTAPCDFGNFSAYCAEEYGECWYEPFPCVPRNSHHIFLRGETFAEGFVWREKPD